MRISAVTAMVFFGTVGLAQAQSSPNLVGVWKGPAVAVGIGSTPYRVPDVLGPVFYDTPLEFTYTITQQQGTRFSGTLTSGKGTETVIGALKPPAYNSGVFLDDDGRYEFTVRDANTIDFCYEHQYPKTKVVACSTLVKQ